MKIQLGKYGEVEAVKPKSLATCLDFVMLFGSGELNQAQLLRLCASVISVWVDGARILPAYPYLDGNPVEFGHKVLDRLLAQGVAVSSIYEIGTKLLNEMSDGILFTDEVDSKANFTQAKGED